MKKSKMIRNWILIFIGATICIFSPKIVTPGLELTLGTERLVGEHNVSRDADGTYVYTNPGAIVKWIDCVCLIGIGVASIGIGSLLLRGCGSKNQRVKYWHEFGSTRIAVDEFAEGRAS